MSDDNTGVKQLRLVIHAEDYEGTLRFFRDVLGMSEQEAYTGDAGAQVAILDAGRATLEIANTAQVEMIDDVEVGRRVSPHLRLALEVDDAAAAATAAVGGGARVVAPPTPTPWAWLNARLDAPGGVHLTLFEELGPNTAQPGRTPGTSEAE
ncbi:VOC family protein [Segeticoccus rhizosphaerae]|uniref:VOC family protein n=2 Tax=Segeticoccus rhizosphaerae TaxID=1104777 RepID=UPI001EE406CD|nr:VOC family protein [Ornithinicoccus soli]